MRTVLLFAIALLTAQSAMAQSSRDYAIMARSTWAGFECSILASHLKDAREAERLFHYGYKQGKAFIAAVQANKVKEEDLQSEAPWVVVALMQGPSADFMLGRIYENAMDYTLKDILTSGNQMNPDDLQKSLTQGKLMAKNCRVVGLAK